MKKFIMLILIAVVFIIASSCRDLGKKKTDTSNVDTTSIEFPVDTTLVQSLVDSTLVVE